MAKLFTVENGKVSAHMVEKEKTPPKVSLRGRVKDLEAAFGDLYASYNQLVGAVYALAEGRLGPPMPEVDYTPPTEEEIAAALAEEGDEEND